MNERIKGRIEETIRQSLAELILRKVKDPRVADVSILRVSVSRDYSVAKVYFNLIGGSQPERISEAEKGLASSRVYNALSPRATLALDRFSRALALLAGRKTADKNDLFAVAPHVLGHRLEPTADFRAEYADRRRQSGATEGAELARQLVLGVEANFWAACSRRSAVTIALDPASRSGEIGE